MSPNATETTNDDYIFALLNEFYKDDDVLTELTNVNHSPKPATEVPVLKIQKKSQDSSPSKPKVSLEPENNLLLKPLYGEEPAVVPVIKVEQVDDSPKVQEAKIIIAPAHQPSPIHEDDEKTFDSTFERKQNECDEVQRVTVMDDYKNQVTRKERRRSVIGFLNFNKHRPKSTFVPAPEPIPEDDVVADIEPVLRRKESFSSRIGQSLRRTFSSTRTRSGQDGKEGIKRSSSRLSMMSVQSSSTMVGMGSETATMKPPLPQRTRTSTSSFSIFGRKEKKTETSEERIKRYTRMIESMKNDKTLQAELQVWVRHQQENKLTNNTSRKVNEKTLDDLLKDLSYLLPYEEKEQVLRGYLIRAGYDTTLAVTLYMNEKKGAQTV